MKQPIIEYFLGRLGSEEGRRFLWSTTDTRSIIRAINQPGRHEDTGDIRYDRVERLLAIRPPPIRVCGDHEAKAHKYWRSNMRTPSGAARNTLFTNRIDPSATALIRVYLDGTHDGHHRFSHLVDVSPPHLLDYWAGERRCVVPVWRMEIPLIGWIEYAYGSWQRQTPLALLGSGMYPQK